MRLESWKKERQQILDWVGSSLPDLQLLPEDVRQQTDVLMEADLFAVDSSGALSIGLWPALPGLWAERKGTEFDKFAQVETWVDALLQLTAPVLGTGAMISVAGGTASGVAGAGASGAASSGPAGAAGSGGGVLMGTAGVTGVLGIGTVAAAGSAPVTAVSGGSAGAGGLGAGVPSGTAGATTGPGTGTAAAVFPPPAAAVDPDAIAADIATALGGRLDALGSRIAHLEARGAAPAGASLLSGVAPPEAELLARALRDSVATAESWDMPRCALACADLVHEAAKLRPQLTLLKEIHPFGKLPMKALEANAFPAMVYALPELATEECELDELPAGKEATQEHWRAFVHLLQARVGDFQHFVKSKAEEAVVEAVVAEVAAVAVAFRMSATATTVATADTSLTAISGIHEAPAGAEEFPVVVPGPAVEVDMAPVVETEVEGEATLVKRARVELESEVPMGGLASKRCLYIKMQGDWKSDCFERYCELDTEQKLVLPGAMAEAAAALL
ncbi:hypothetical protein CYMTET_30696 [Cymbomonas tetramitiformis]|uniref:Uncharacterized protein n=1 Tax=Cymbomonas tetramitiformis TaxID=36881 RepID=A0AAE0FIG4_9CHLO|nr:hypothetical protein CYMTET_30696 [Cymbomonas tetramitiformis]